MSVTDEPISATEHLIVTGQVWTALASSKLVIPHQLLVLDGLALLAAEGDKHFARLEGRGLTGRIVSDEMYEAGNDIAEAVARGDGDIDPCLPHPLDMRTLLPPWVVQDEPSLLSYVAGLQEAAAITPESAPRREGVSYVLDARPRTRRLYVVHQLRWLAEYGTAYLPVQVATQDYIEALATAMRIKEALKC